MVDCPSIPNRDGILKVLKGMNKNASPGIDGLNVAFDLSAQKWIGDYVKKLAQDFYHRCKIHPQLNKTYVAFILILFSTRTPQDFKLISLCNVDHKIISKTLANRLKDHLPVYIHETQQDFMQCERIANILMHLFGLKYIYYHC